MSSLPRRYWQEMPSHRFGPAAANWVVVLPLAAIEQHGPHLPVGVDTIIGEGMVTRCADALDQSSPVTFLPVQQVCKSDEHIDFPGTLTLGWQNAMSAWIDIGDSVARAGPKTLVIITSHGGNVAPMEIVARDLRQRHGMRVVTTSWGRLGNWERIYGYEGEMVDIHAGLSETSLMLALRPDLVDMAAARDFASAQTGIRMRTEMLGYHGAPANIAWIASDLNPAGAMGDATRATAALGERDIASMVEGFCKLTKELAALGPDKDVP